MWRSAAESLARLPPRSGAGSPGAHPLVARVAPSTPLADGRDPIAPLYFEEALSDLKSELASGVPVFQSLLRTYLLDNTHRLTHALLPSPGMTASLEAQEAERLAAVRAKLSPDEIAELIKETKELKAAQVRRRRRPRAAVAWPWAAQAAHDPPKALALHAHAHAHLT